MRLIVAIGAALCVFDFALPTLAQSTAVVSQVTEPRGCVEADALLALDVFRDLTPKLSAVNQEVDLIGGLLQRPDQLQQHVETALQLVHESQQTCKAVTNIDMKSCPTVSLEYVLQNLFVLCGKFQIYQSKLEEIKSASQ